MQTYDTVVLGSGPGGGTVAKALAKAGQSVAVCDDPIGGTCALRGCNPKKVLVAQADLVERARRLRGHGLAAEGLALDWPDLIRFKRSFTEPVTERSTASFEKAGIAVLMGKARFTGPRALVLGEQEIAADRIIIATGAEPVPLPIDGADLLTTSAEFLELDALPSRVVFVGAGYVSMELAHVAHAAGAQVTLLERADRILSPFDADLAGRLAELTRERGMGLRTGCQVAAIVRDGDGLTVHVRGDDGQPGALDADLVVHGAGRRPALAGLDLEAAGVTYEAGGVVVDAERRSVSNPAVLAVGDASASALAPLTPAAQHEARLIVDIITRGHSDRAVAPVLPSVAFTVPPLAAVGLLEADARARGIAVSVSEGDTSSWSSVRKTGGHGGAYKVLIDPGTDRILGAHVLGPGAEEVINLFALAMRARMTATEVQRTPFAFPTFASDVPGML